MGTIPMTYKCDACDQVRPRSKLVAKRVQFKQMGTHGAVFRTRTVAWLCKTCMERDPDYNRVLFVDSPGTAAKRET